MPRLIVLAKRVAASDRSTFRARSPRSGAGTNKVCIDSHQVSRHHAAIQWAGDQYMLTDMGSRDGHLCQQ